MDILKNKTGIVLVIALAFLVLFTTIAILHITSTISDFNIAKRSTYSFKAFFLAQAGLHKALYELRLPGNWGWPGEGPVSMDWPEDSGVSKGEYTVAVIVSPTNPSNKLITSTGYYPKSTGSHVRRVVQLEVTPPSNLPSWFFDTVIFAGGNVDITKRDQIDIGEGVGIKYGGTGGTTAEKTTETFPNLDFEALRAEALRQTSNGKTNVYTQADIEAKRAYPTNFYYIQPNPDVPGDLGTPNIIYVEGDLAVKGNTQIGGFYIVAGNVIADPIDEADSEIAGTSSIVGCIYTLGNFEISGGGNALNVDGGVWCRNNFSQGGNGKLSYNKTYMDAVEAIMIMRNLATKVAIKSNSWKEIGAS